MLLPVSAGATHIPGATYTGTVYSDFAYQQPVAGTVELDVSADGATVSRFAATGIEREAPCGPFTQVSTTSITWQFWGQPLSRFSKEQHGFGYSGSPPLVYDAYALYPGQLEGRVSMEDGCGGQVVHYRAAVPGGCEGTPEYQVLKKELDEGEAALAAVKAKLAKLKKAQRRAERKGNDVKAARLERKRDRATGKKRAIKTQVLPLRTAWAGFCAPPPQ